MARAPSTSGPASAESKRLLEDGSRAAGCRPADHTGSPFVVCNGSHTQTTDGGVPAQGYDEWKENVATARPKVLSLEKLKQATLSFGTPN